MRFDSGGCSGRGLRAALLALLAVLAAPLRSADADDRDGPAPDVGKQLEAAATALEGGRLKDAAALYAAAAESALKAKDAAREVDARAGLLQSLLAMHDARRALPAAKTLAELQKREGLAKNAERTLSDVAGVLIESGRAKEATEILDGLILRAESSKDAELSAVAFENRSIARKDLGRFAEAISDAEESVRRWQALGSQPDEIGATVNLASILTAIGAVARARTLEEKALKLLGTADSVDRANALGNLGFLLYEHVGDVPGGIARLEECTEMASRLKEVRSEGLGRVHLARALRIAGRAKEAEEAADLAATLLPADDPLLVFAHVEASDAVLAQPERPPSAALSHLEKASDLAERLGSQYLEFECHRGRADYLLAIKTPAAAVAEARKAVEIAELAELGLPDEQAALSRSHHRGALTAGIRAAVALNDPDLITEFLERGRAGALLTSLGGREASWELASAAQRSKERAARERVVDAQLGVQALLREGVREKVAVARAALAAAHSDYIAATDALQRESRLVSPASRKGLATAAAIRSSLKSGEALILYTTETDPVGALVITQDAAKWHELVPRSKLAELLGGDRPKEARKGLSELEAIRAALVDPLLPDPPARTVYVSPDGPLATVPFPGLFLLRGDEKPVDVSIVPSATVLEWLTRDAARTGRGVFAIGNPDYSSARSKAVLEAFGLGDLRALPKTAIEAVQVASGPDDEHLVGAAATEKNIRAKAASRPRWKLILFACHGTADVTLPSRSALIVTPEGEDDGFLTAREVFGSAFRADAVALAACDSASGRAVAGEGLYGLPRAFLCAGTPRVVGSVWRVDDGATRLLATTFAKAWEAGAGAAEALRQGQVAVRAKPEWKEPRYWAPWVVWGLPR